MALRQEFEASAQALLSIGTDGFWAALIALIKRVIRFDEGLVLSYPVRGTPFCSHHCLGQNRAQILVTDYLAGAYLLDPFHSVAMTSSQEGPIALRDVAPDAFHKTKYYELHYAHTDVGDEVGIFIRAENGLCDVISLLRKTQTPHFSPDEVASLADRSPLILALVHMHRSAGKLHDHAEHHKGTFRSLEDILAGTKMGLSDRETEIAALILRGHSSLSIATNLGIVEGTVKIHRKNIYRKFGISSQAELFAFFLSQILTPQSGT